MSKPDPNAKNKAHEYKAQQTADKTEQEIDRQRQAERPQIRNEQDFMDLVGQRIEEAIRAGAFDNLRGKGKPLNLQRNPFVPEEMEMAYSIMQNHQIAPEWINDRSEILRRVEAFRGRLRSAVAAYQGALHGAADAPARGRIAQAWLTQLSELETQLGALNRQIGIVNLKQPTIHLEIFKLRMDEELARAGLTSTL